MFLNLNHQKLHAYHFSKLFVLECYKVTKTFPQEEKFGIISQVRRAALSVHLNISEGASRKSEAERKRFYEIARSSVVEVDAALDIAKELNYLEDYNLKNLSESTITCFKIITAMIR